MEDEGNGSSGGNRGSHNNKGRSKGAAPVRGRGGQRQTGAMQQGEDELSVGGKAEGLGGTGA
eukprot:9488237-Pyramimonas_sp.AAC.1